MTNTTIFNAFGTATDLQMSGLEKAFNLRLPRDYTRLLQRYNGGTLSISLMAVLIRRKESQSTAFMVFIPTLPSRKG